MKTGKLPENVLKRSVLGQIGAKGKEVQSGAGIGKDCAILAFPENEKITVCMQEAFLPLQSPKEVPGAALTRSPGELLQKCANNLGAGGSRPFAFMVTLLLPEDTEEGNVRALMEEAQEKVLEMSADLSVGKNAVKIIGGQTRIGAGLTIPAAVVTGFGKPWEKEGVVPPTEAEKVLSGSGFPEGDLSGKVRPGQDVVLSKWIGLEGTAVLAQRNREMLSKRYPAWLAEEAAGFKRYLSVLPEAEEAVKFGVSAMHDASEGGIFGALWELAEGAETGLTIDTRKLPLRQETVEVCECCNVNPYELLSGGCLVMITEDGRGLAAVLERKGIPAAIVGKVTDGNARILTNGSEVRYMDRPRRDSVYQDLKA